MPNFAIRPRARASCFREWPHGRKNEAVADAIRAEGGSAEPLLADVTDVGQVNAALQTVADSGLPLELAIYNAGNNRPEAF